MKRDPGTHTAALVFVAFVLLAGVMCGIGIGLYIRPGGF